MEPLLRNQSAPGAFAGIAEQYGSEMADETTCIKQSAGRATSTYGSVSTLPSGPRARKYASKQQSGGAAAAAAAAAAATTTAAGQGVAGSTNADAPSPSASSSPASSTNAWKDFWAGFQSIELENKGSVARDHLALERTFLAWLRTSLAFASIGIAVTQLFRLNTSTTGGSDGNDANDGNDEKSSFNTLESVGRPLGTTFLGISVLILFLGYHRYYQSQQWILKGKFPASRGTILLVSLVAFALMVTSLVVVVVLHPT